MSHFFSIHVGNYDLYHCVAILQVYIFLMFPWMYVCRLSFYCCASGYFDQNMRSYLFSKWVEHLQQALIQFKPDLARVEVEHLQWFIFFPTGTSFKTEYFRTDIAWIMQSVKHSLHSCHFCKYPAIHTSYVIQHCTTLQYNLNIWHSRNNIFKTKIMNSTVSPSDACPLIIKILINNL